ncbi:unnamed protein product [Debaryomyces tyrocola]|nr:unnamed protein product [Debaryomyces tyrocola]
MGILSKLSPEKHPYFNKAKTHRTNLSENSSCSLTGSEFLLTGSHSSNSSNEATGIPMNKVNSGAPRRVKNLPIALTPNIGGDKLNFPTGPTNKKTTLKEGARRSDERKPPTPLEKEPQQVQVRKGQRHPYTAQIRNRDQDAHTRMQQPDQTGNAYFKPRPNEQYSPSQMSPQQVNQVNNDYSKSTPNEQYSHNHANPQQINQSSPHEVPMVQHQNQMGMNSPLPIEQMYSEKRQARRTQEDNFQAQPPTSSKPSMAHKTTNCMPMNDGMIKAPQNMRTTLSQHEYDQNDGTGVNESEDNSDDYSEADSEADSEEYTDTSEESVSNDNVNTSYSTPYVSGAQQHPYYEQWMQYYASLAAQKQQQQMPNRSSMYGYPMTPDQYSNMNTVNGQISSASQQAPYYSYGSNHLNRKLHSGNSIASYSDNNNNDFLTHYKRRSGPNSISDTSNELISNSRRSTIKSNRYPSVPLSILESESKVPEKLRATRVSSLDLNFKPKEYHNYNDDYNEDQQEQKSLRYNEDADVPKQGQSSTTSVAFGLLNMALDDKTEKRQISDYSKFLFEGDSQVEEEEEEEEEQEEEEKEKEYSTGTKNKLLYRRPSHEMSRKESMESNNSFGSIRSEASNNFKVKSLPPSKNVQESNSNIEEKDRQKKGKRKVRHERKSSSFNPNLSISSQADLLNVNNTAQACQQQANMMPYLGHSQMPSMESMPSNPNAIPFNQPMMAYNTEYQGVVPPMAHSRRQSIATAESKRQSMMFAGNGMPPYGPQPMNSNRMSMPVMGMNTSNKPTQIRTTDGKIKQKVEEFVELRKVIASGNKSLEYRLKWIKMLINATNYRLYAFVNIKGEPAPQDFSQHNKALFLKSSINHLLKLIKEYEVGKKNDNIHSQVCYIYGCLLKHDYAASYNQDFGIEKDIQESISYFEKSLELNPNNFKSLYKLGEIFEYDFPDQFDQALRRYKEAAKLGYNQAIYKMALLYLNVPLIRSTKFFNYFVELSNIDLSSKDVELTGEDRDELEEIIGLTFYQLGKIYEGIYPGDLHAEDEFISKSLERAPVNYAKGLTYYNKSAKLDCLLAQVKLGSVYENGELNRQQNPSKSIQWYMKAVSSPLLFKRHPDAMLGLSRWNLKGSDGLSKYITSPDPEKAVMWCDRAIKEFNSPDAYFAMAQLNEMGLGDRNPQPWYFKAHELGHNEASFKLGYA